VSDLDQTACERDDASAIRSTVTVIDNRTGQSFELPIEDGAVLSADIGRLPGGLAACRARLCAAARSRTSTARPGSCSTVATGSRFCEHSTFIELAYLLIKGDLPTAAQLDQWTHEIATRKFVHENLKSFLEGFRYNAHPIAMLAASVGAPSSFYPDAGDVYDKQARERQS
jgi:citrate synthase